MRRIIYFILAFVIWILLTWPFVDGQIDLQVVAAGVISAALVSILFHEMLPKEHHVFISPVRVFWFIVCRKNLFFS